MAKDKAYIIESKSEKAYSSDGLKLIVIIKNGKVKKIDAKGNSETPGLGTKAFEDTYLNKFIGLSFQDMTTDDSSANENNGIEIIWGFDNIHAQSGATPSTEIDEQIEFDTISGATKSSQGVINAVYAALRFYEFMEAQMIKKSDIVKWNNKNNPTFRLVLGTCPTLLVTTSVMNSISMGLATTFVLICSNI